MVKVFLWHAVQAQRGSRGIALHMFNCCAIQGWVVKSTPWPLYSHGSTTLLIVHEAGWCCSWCGWVWSRENLPHGISLKLDTWKYRQTFVYAPKYGFYYANCQETDSYSKYGRLLHRILTQPPAPTSQWRKKWKSSFTSINKVLLSLYWFSQNSF